VPGPVPPYAYMPGGPAPGSTPEKAQGDSQKAPAESAKPEATKG
jgi:hypothetical protein